MGRAVLFHRHGQALDVAEVATPEPRGAEVLVRITACTLCRSDLHTHAGRRTEATPTILGHEIVGRIAAFGPDAAQVDGSGRPARLGDRVTWAVAVGCGQCYFCVDDLPQKCAHPFKYGHQQATAATPLAGGLADHVILVPNTFWLRVPDEIPDLVAAPANCATATVAAVLRYAGAVTGRTVVVLGAGVLGLTACAMARAAKARTVIACDPAAASRERALAFGATHAFDADPEELTARVGELTGGRGADVVLELAGAAPSVATGLALVRTGGTLILAGTVAPTSAVALDPEQLVRRMLTVRGVHNYHPRDLKAALMFLAGPGLLYPFQSLIVGEFPLDQSEQAFAQAHAHPGVRVAVVASTGETP